MLKKVSFIVGMGCLLFSLTACGSGQQTTGDSTKEKTQITIFAAKSLSTVVDELATEYQTDHSNVEILANYDGSGTLMEQIKEGAACDIFFSAAEKQMDELEAEDLVVEATRKNVVNNQVCVVTYKGSNTKVTGLRNLKDASSIAMADGSVPVGKYTRQAMVNAGMLPPADDTAAITTQEISEALGQVEINECGNVGAVAAAVSEGSNEVGTVYRSDTAGYEDKLQILEVIGYDLTGDVIYPIAQIANEEAGEEQLAVASDFVEYLTSDHAKEVYEKYYFDTNVK